MPEIEPADEMPTESEPPMRPTSLDQTAGNHRLSCTLRAAVDGAAAGIS
jgi:hypothetical protein